MPTYRQPTVKIPYHNKSLPMTNFRNMSQGRISNNAVNNFMIQSVYPNSVSMAYNIDFDTIVGSGAVRQGTTPLGSVVASGKSPLGLAEFVGLNGTPNVLLSVFPGASTATVYYYNGSWNASGLTTLNNNNNCRFANLGGLSFVVNGADAMKSSVDGNTWGTTNCITAGITPSLIYRYAGVLLAAGNSGNKDRVYFSSVVDLTLSPTLTWNTADVGGDWIDINPDDGDNITGFSDVGGSVLVFKNNGFYRLDSITKASDPSLIYDKGAVSQEAITKCQGSVYFFNGNAIYTTTGGYPSQISRFGVQDFIDAIPQANWKNVCLGADAFNVYASIGEVTINGLTNYIVLKFSTLDQSWTVRYYPVQYMFFSPYTSTDGRLLRGADNSGYVQTMDSGMTDNNTSIFYSLETQEMEFGDRASTNVITDKIAVFTRNGKESRLEWSGGDKDYQDLPCDLSQPVTILENLNIQGRYLKFRWSGVTSGSSPVFEGLEFPDVDDQGVNNDL